MSVAWIGKDKLFTGGAGDQCAGEWKSAFRLSTTYKTGEPLVGYGWGRPSSRRTAAYCQVVACSRPS